MFFLGYNSLYPNVIFEYSHLASWAIQADEITYYLNAPREESPAGVYWIGQSDSTGVPFQYVNSAFLPSPTWA